MKDVEKKKRILVISQYFYPEEFRINDISSEWVKRGCDVTVVTGIPNYPQGKYFEGYGLFKKRHETHSGVDVRRIPLIPRGKNGGLLPLNYISFVVSGFFWSHFTRLKADQVFIFQMSPMTQALVGVWFAKRRKIPCCIYVQDLWPESVEAITGVKNAHIIGMIDKMVNYVYRNCDIILATSPSFVEEIEKRESAVSSIGKSKVVYWPQYAEDFYKPADQKGLDDLWEKALFRIVFTGNIGYAQGLNILPMTAEKLRNKNIDCEFVIIGDGRYRAELEAEIKQKKLQSMFRFLGRKLPQEIPEYLALCDVAFLSFADNRLFTMTIPAKLQSYMACGMPILAAAAGETKRVIEEAECGWVVPMGDADHLAEAVIAAAESSTETRNRMKENALAYCDQHFNKKRLMDALEQLWKSDNSKNKEKTF